MCKSLRGPRLWNKISDNDIKTVASFFQITAEKKLIHLVNVIDFF